MSRQPWRPLEELLDMPLPDRIRYVRHNLPSPRKHSQLGYMTQDEFAGLLGVGNRQTVIRWERGEQQPRLYAKALAELTGYPPSAFLRPEPSRDPLAAEVAELRERVIRLQAAVDALRDEFRARLGPPAHAQGTWRSSRDTP